MRNTPVAYRASLLILSLAESDRIHEARGIARALEAFHYRMTSEATLLAAILFWTWNLPQVNL